MSDQERPLPVRAPQNTFGEPHPPFRASPPSDQDILARILAKAEKGIDDAIFRLNSLAFELESHKRDIADVRNELAERAQTENWKGGEA